MKRGQAFVRGKNKEGKWTTLDALDLDDESFRAFILDRLCFAGLVYSMREELVEGNPIEYKERS